MLTKDYEQLKLEHDLLLHLSRYDTPVGATTLVLVMDKEFGLSQASIGRKLMEFDALGYTESVGRKGRVLATIGRERLKSLERELAKFRDNAKLMQALHVSDKQSLIDLLVARRALERETVWLAAQHATEEQVNMLWESIARQNKLMADGKIPIQEDREFHELIAKASGNFILLHALQLVWGEGAHLPATALIRRSVGSELVVDHQKIVECIATGSPYEAASAMVTHINQMIEDVHKYYDQIHAQQ